ncbi:MAG: hypothetical protein BWY80_00286 [Firmicutes bacterium ADurb.Bin456]|nr:MAG: hypothetical protein BWY80_00286 [Firmicutes bacterium ADurb.Bin456]
MPLCPQDMQPPQFNHPAAIPLHLPPVLFQQGLVGVVILRRNSSAVQFGGSFQIMFLLAPFLPGQEFRVAAQHNISSPPGHVGGNGYGAQAPGLGDNFCFLVMVLSVQNLVLDTLAL